MKKLWTVSNIIYGISIIYAAGVMAKVYYDNSKLPEGVCPITNNNGFIYSAIGILIIGIVVTSILDYKKKKKSEEQ